MKFHEAEGVLL